MKVAAASSELFRLGSRVGVAHPVGAHPPQGQVALVRLGHAGRVSHAARDLEGPAAPGQADVAGRKRVRAREGARRLVGLVEKGAGLRGVRLASRGVDAGTRRERHPVPDRALVLGEGPRHADRDAGDHGLGRVARARHLVRRVPVPLVALEAQAQPAEDRLDLAARGARVRLSAHGVGAGLGQRGRAPLVGHPVIDPREVALRANARAPGPQAGGLVAQVQAIRVVPQGVHQQVGVENVAGVLAGVGEVELMARRGRPHHPPPGGADREGPTGLVLRPVVRDLGEAASVAVAEGVGCPVRVACERRDPLAAAAERERGVHEAEGARGQGRRRVPARLGLAGHHVDGAAEGALVLHVERPLAHLDAVHLREVHVERGGVHVVRAGPVDALPVDEDVEVAALQAAQHDVGRDPALSQPPHSGLGAQGLADVDGGRLAQLRGLERRARRLAHDAHGLAEARHLEREHERRLLAGAHDDVRRRPPPRSQAARRARGTPPARARAVRNVPRLPVDRRASPPPDSLASRSTTPGRRAPSRDVTCPAMRPRASSARAPPATRPKASTNTTALMAPSPGRSRGRRHRTAGSRRSMDGRKTSGGEGVSRRGNGRGVGPGEGPPARAGPA